MAEQTGRIKSEASFEDIGRVFSEKQCEPTSLFKFGKIENPRIVVSMRDAGETNSLLPVVNKLIEEGKYSVSVFADGWGAKLLNDQTKIEKQDIKKDILVMVANEVDKSELVLVSQSCDSGIDMALAATANEGGKVVISVEDFLGAVPVQDEGILKNKSTLLIPDWHCVMNKWSKDNLLKLNPNLDPNKILITGSPAFDNLDLDAKEKVRNEFRKKHSIGDSEQAIVWMGQIGEANDKSLELFLDTLGKIGLDNYRLIIRRHPRDERSFSFYEGLMGNFFEHVLDTAGEQTEEVRRGADLVVTMFSTEGLKAICEQTPTLFILIPEFLRLSRYDQLEFPVEQGSAAIVKEKETMKEELKKVLLDDAFCKQIETKMKDWKVDGNATDRIVNLIKENIHK